MTSRCSLIAAALLAVAGVALAQPQPTTPATAPKATDPAKTDPTKKDTSDVTLKVGSKAPEIKADKWVKGTEVKSFASGKVYVVEFWATWCPPCRESIPGLLTELAKTHKDVTVIGMASSETSGQARDRQDAAERLEKFVKDKGSEMDYTHRVRRVAGRDGQVLAPRRGPGRHPVRLRRRRRWPHHLHWQPPRPRRAHRRRGQGPQGREELREHNQAPTAQANELTLRPEAH